jgi:hypothetical protein
MEAPMNEERQMIPERSGRTVTISVPRAEGRRLRVDMVLMVPASVEVVTSIAKGDIRADGLQGSAEFRVARASIDAAVRTGRISSILSLAQVTSDRRSLRGILNEPGAKVAMRTVSGDIDITGHET